MSEVHLFVGLLAAVVLLALVASPLRLPHAVVLVLGGIALGAAPFAPDVRLNPELIFLVFLPPIIYPAAFRFAGEDIRPNLRAIGWLAIGLVLVTMAAIAVAAHALAGIPWAAAFALGAILAPTDPVAATSILRRSGASTQIATILEGESLVNDGTGLTAFRIAVAAVGTGTFSLGASVLDFAEVALGGAAIGAVLGWLVAELRRRLDELEMEAAIAVLLAYGSFVLAEELGVSGILATVLAGYMVGRRSTVIASPETRMQSASFWDVVSFLAESMLFLLIGIAFARVVSATDVGWELAWVTVVVALVTIGVRIAWVFTVPHLVAAVQPGRHHAPVPARERLVIGVAGMRGAVSAAAALSVPAVAGGAPFPERDALLVIALGSVVLTLVLPTLALPHVLRALGLGQGDEEREQEVNARVRIAHAALSRVEELASEEAAPEQALRRARERYEWRVTRLERRLRAEENGGHHTERYGDLRRRLLSAEREALDDLRERGEVSGAPLRTIERDLDLEESRLV